MARGQVMVPTPQGGFKWVRWGAVYNDSGEVPLFTTYAEEGEMRWYGSGLAEVVVRVMPIILRLPITLLRGAIRWVLSESVRREAAMALRKIVAEAATPGVAGAGATDAAQWPNLLEHMTLDRYPDGSARKLSCVVVTAGPAGWQGCVSDKDNNRVMWKTSSTLEGLLLALEEGLAADDPSSWRQSADAKFRGRKRS